LNLGPIDYESTALTS